MNEHRSQAITILSITAVILLVANILPIGSGGGTASAIGQTDRGGDYILVTGQFTNSSEMVYVTDAAMHRMIAYGYDFNVNGLRIWDLHDFARELGRPARADDGERRR